MEWTGARKTFPCFDEPSLKATFVVTLWHKTDTGFFSLSNMPVASQQVFRTSHLRVENSLLYKIWLRFKLRDNLLILIVIRLSHNLMRRVTMCVCTPKNMYLGIVSDHLPRCVSGVPNGSSGAELQKSAAKDTDKDTWKREINMVYGCVIGGRP